MSLPTRKQIEADVALLERSFSHAGQDSAIRRVVRVVEWALSLKAATGDEMEARMRDGGVGDWAINNRNNWPSIDAAFRSAERALLPAWADDPQTLAAQPPASLGTSLEAGRDQEVMPDQPEAEAEKSLGGVDAAPPPVNLGSRTQE